MIPSRNRPQGGFTLIEVLVALAVLAIALSAIVKGGAENARNAAYLRDRTVAQWVALNKAAELQLADSWPATGESNGESEMAGHQWRWTAWVSDTFDADVRRLEVSAQGVGGAAEGPLAQVTAFLPRPPVATGESQ